MPNISRKNMPQIDTQNLSKAMDMVSDTVKVTKGTIEAGKLKKSQKELYKDKIEGIAKKFTSPDKFKPLIISKDNYVVDGHHRWGAAIYKWGNNVKIPIFRINLPIIDAIKLYKDIANSINETIKKVDGKYVVYPKKGGDRLGTHDTKSAAEKQLAAIEISKHKNEDITIPLNVGDTVLGGKFKNKAIVVKSIDKNEKGDITINGKPLLKYRLLKTDTPTQLGEDLRKWFGKGKTGTTTGGGWDRYDSKGKKVGKCGDSEEGEPYAACLSKEKADKLGPDGRASFVRRKRTAQKDVGDAKKGKNRTKGKTPTMVKTGASESAISELNLFLEKNVPTDPQKWAYAKSQAKQKFDVYPSAYANGWAAKKYKELGGGWKTESLDTEKNNSNELNEGMYDPKNIKAYYEALAKSEDVKPLPVKFESVGKGGAVLSYNSKTMKPLYISFDVSRLSDPEFAIIHELTHQIKLETEGDAYVGKRDQLAKFKKLENHLIDKYVYSKYSKLLYEFLNEIPMSDLQKIDTFADKQLDPVDVVLTDKHFFDRLTDPRNDKEISPAELIGFFKRLSKKKKEFVEFLNKYNSLVAVDGRTDLNIPFMKRANKAIAKTIMRKKDFKTSDKKLEI